jgi:hypothetical protein
MAMTVEQARKILAVVPVGSPYYRMAVETLRAGSGPCGPRQAPSDSPQVT